VISKDDIEAMAHTKEQKEFWEVPMKIEVGKTYEVLIEGPSKRSETHFQGRNSANKVIIFPKY